MNLRDQVELLERENFPLLVVREKLSSKLEKVERAKIARKQLREEEFTRLKEEYFRLVNEDDKEIMYPTIQQECEQAAEGAADAHGGLAGAAGQPLASGSALWFQEWKSCGRGEGQVW